MREDLQKELAERLKVLKNRQERMTRDLQNADERLPSDWSDQAIVRENDEVLEGLSEAAREEIAAIERALTRMAEGTWEICAQCDQPIESKRLAALPTTALCRHCAK